MPPAVHPPLPVPFWSPPPELLPHQVWKTGIATTGRDGLLASACEVPASHVTTALPSFHTHASSTVTVTAHHPHDAVCSISSLDLRVRGGRRIVRGGVMGRAVRLFAKWETVVGVLLPTA
eukprot:3698770-Rhodomonas_salina.2